MASLRSQIVAALVARFNTVPGWTAVERGALDSVAATKAAYVYDIGERPQETRQQAHPYHAMNLDVRVVIRAKVEDAGPAGFANPFAYVDQLLTELQQVVEDPPFDYGIGQELNLRQLGHDVQAPDENNRVGIVWNLSLGYRHNRDDPELYTATF